MSTSHDKGAVLYIVSRSGKVLGSEERSRRFAPDDYFEGELEGWIFWGSKRTSGSSGSKRVSQETSPSGSHGKSFLGGSFQSLSRTSRKKRIPFAAWGDELATLNEVITPLTRRQARSQQKRSSSKRESLHGRRAGEGRKDGDAEYESSGSARSQAMSCHFERWDRMEQNLKIGLAQLAILHKWEAGTRELAARWVAWLLKMLRKARPHPRPLQHLLFTMCGAVLPVICRSLVRESWTRSPDPELCRCVDIFLKALEKSQACFSPLQWEILEEKMDECRKLRLKIASLLQKRELQSATSSGKYESSGVKPKKQQASGGGLIDAPRFPSEEAPDPQSQSDTKDEKLSNTLVQNEGVPALVKRALREKLFTPRSKGQEGRVSGDLSGGSGTIVSLLCPLSGSRVKVPARGRSCSHRASFDLQAYLEVRAKDETSRCSTTHLRKKQKMETTWCCPICGSDATWPQIIVDRVLLRILEVLPENMPQVCLLPNGRWRIVWSPVADGLGKTDTGSAKVSVHSLSRYGVITETRHTGQPRESKLDAVKESCHRSNEAECRCETEWHALDRAFRSWKEGIELLSKGGGASRQRDGHLGLQFTVANLDGDQKPKVDASSTIPEKVTASAGALVKLDSEVPHGRDIIPAEKRSPRIEELSPLSREVREISKPENAVMEKTGEDGGIQGALLRNVVVEAFSGTPFVFGENGGMYARMRVGQHKARRKQMAKKT
ncbi:hypothetical protein AXG93_4820s1010 [Marchantia polymorpha subsp. ruderalis]|uniref:SP-RING-type domain-containing protein n=1 Tax=Marchantia polymorpha subsp. ruderalis TaxID=1480154 RepID=A0A176VVW0_MARPO|nr:hypothetical protein AXG93_4820s1010 [Marchantia polymorpha subsp. ruderalis]